jgi:hypothetical protein
MMVMEPPIGFVRLRDAIYAVGDKIFGSEWCLGQSAAERLFDPKPEHVISMIAEWCEAGEIAAVYRSITGVDHLDRSVWRRPHWRHYFSDGTIDLDLPLVDENLRPNPDGYTARCTREIYLRRDDLDRLIATLSKPNPKPLPKASNKQIREIMAQYRRTLPADVNPSMDNAVRFAEEKGVTGHREELREEYRQQFDHPRVGRPSK